MAARKGLSTEPCACGDLQRGASRGGEDAYVEQGQLRDVEGEEDAVECVGFSQTRPSVNIPTLTQNTWFLHRIEHRYVSSKLSTATHRPGANT